MATLSRIAMGTVQPLADGTAITWALMEALGRRDLRVQSFLSHAYFCPRDGATAITGFPARHLDSWLMTRPVCQQVFARGCANCELALVEGTYSGDVTSCCTSASNFEALCEWLDLPRLAVVDARLLTACRLPPRPSKLDGVLLDRVHDAAELSQLQTQFESLWKVPVLGSLGELTALRAEIAGIDCGSQPSLPLCRALGDAFARQTRIEPILKLAASRPWQNMIEAPAAFPSGSRRPLRVAVAYDDAFRGYFPDSLDLLERRGATILDFSPLHDERLPPHTDVVYVGCGHPERFARDLAENDCLVLALKSHVSSGGRVYAECGGLAYLCQELELPDGQRWPMAGVLPATARFDPTTEVPTPSEVCLSDDNWLGAAGQTWRGYLSPRWSLSSTDQLQACGATGHECDVVKCHQAVGSRMYVNFAAHDAMLDHFFAPRGSIPERVGSAPSE
jgi:cobyrinic acid a,c-diamide synthase